MLLSQGCELRRAKHLCRARLEQLRVELSRLVTAPLRVQISYLWVRADCCCLPVMAQRSFGGMMTYWLFQFMGAFLAAAVYKIVCGPAASRKVFCTSSTPVHRLRCQGAPHLAVVAPVPPFNAGYVAALAQSPSHPPKAVKSARTHCKPRPARPHWI